MDKLELCVVLVNSEILLFILKSSRRDLMPPQLFGLLLACPSSMGLKVLLRLDILKVCPLKCFSVVKLDL